MCELGWALLWAPATRPGLGVWSRGLFDGRGGTLSLRGLFLNTVIVLCLRLTM